LFQTYAQLVTGKQYQLAQLSSDLDNSCLLLHKAWQISDILWLTLFTALNSKIRKRKINNCKPADKKSKNCKDEKPAEQENLSGSNKLAAI